MYRVFNDSKSSNWHATVAAMNCFEQERMILILGGQKRANQKVVELKDLKNRQLEKILCIGESGLDLSLELATIAPAVYINTIDQIPLHIPNEFRGVVLFSPAYPSFDQFKNYVDRGQQFKKLFF
jgi:UDP-N-acetylmuramoylalanine--D-glutamate ligase